MWSFRKNQHPVSQQYPVSSSSLSSSPHRLQCVRYSYQDKQRHKFLHFAKPSIILLHLFPTTTMNKFIATLFIVAAIAVNSASAFTTQSHSVTTSRRTANFDLPSATLTSSSTALNLKVDPKSIEGGKNNAGNAKMAAYGGSVAIAALLPIAFLIWSAISK